MIIVIKFLRKFTKKISNHPKINKYKFTIKIKVRAKQSQQLFFYKKLLITN